MVSLPKPWVSEMGLGAGDQVSLTRNPDRSLTLGPGPAEGAGGEASFSIGARDTAEAVRRRVTAAYVAGYGSIRVSSRGAGIGQARARAVGGLVRSAMIGAEITEAGPGSLRVQVLGRLPGLSVGVALGRMHAAAAWMHGEAVEALASRDAGRAAGVAAADDEVDRFGLYVLRCLTVAVQDAGAMRELGAGGPADCLGYRAAASGIERVADHAALAAKRVKFLDGPIEGRTMGRIRALSGEALALFDRAAGALARRDYAMAESVAEGTPRVAAMQEEAMAGVRGSSGSATVARFALDGIRRTAEHSCDIAEVAMDMSVRSVVD